ncbi:MAG: hypothetical protein COW30_02895 [Rhodospirillales bacterium CG15_BIG_FIL_POST_REV_8_21_14_020_66_15]|nr:MAG: hypothetical protein COW30_02895 [Rhodospirillales bacterium CG15_BIG_FIL_POST_REV_8_21_14_020_66_15]
MKKVLIGLGAVIVIVIGVGIYLFMFAGDLIKTAVESIGSDATQAKVTLKAVDIDMFQGTGGMRGLVVGNPKGFKTPSAFELGNISLVLDKNSIGKNPIVIKSITITGPVVTYEKSGGTSNVDAIKANVDAYAKKFGGTGGAAKKEPSSAEEQKLVIEKLTVTGGKARLNAGVLGDKTLDASLPDLTLTDIGKDSGGSSPAQVAKAVIDKLTAGVMAIYPEKLIGNAAAALEGAAKGATDAMKGAAGGAGDAVKGVTEGAGKAMEGAGEKLKGLFQK